MGGIAPKDGSRMVLAQIAMGGILGQADMGAVSFGQPGGLGTLSRGASAGSRLLSLVALGLTGSHIG
jgi:hypothetical protein